MIGKSETDFVEHRREGLQSFCQQMAQLKHLWYSVEFQGFLRFSGDLQSHLKSLPQENEQTIIKKYDQILTNLRGKNIDNSVISKVNEFRNYLKKVQPLISGFKDTIILFLQAKNNNYDQYAVLYNYLLPEYEKICLSGYLDEQTDGKLIFADDSDSMLNNLLSDMKDIMSSRNYNQLLTLIQREDREINSFLDVYRILTTYEKKLIDLKQKQKQLELEQQKLNAGKQSLLKSIFKSNIEDNKRETERELAITKQWISSCSLLCDLINLLLGCFEIDRFKSHKLATYQYLLKEIAIIQVQFSRAHQQIAKHILDKHTLS